MDGFVCPECRTVSMPGEPDTLCCEKCDAYVHMKCDEEGAASLQDPYSEPYACPGCRGRTADDLLLQYGVHLRCLRPSRPHSAFHLFSLDMMKKYTEGGYSLDFREAAPLIGDAWRELPLQRRRVYERSAAQEMLQYQAARVEYDSIFNEYLQLVNSLQRAPEFDLILDAERAPTLLLPPPPAVTAGKKRPHLDSEHTSPAEASRKDPDATRPKKQVKEEKTIVKEEMVEREPRQMDDLTEVAVVCNGIKATFLLGPQRLICKCKDCAKKPPEERELTPTQFEQHCGSGSAKKWKSSIRVEPGAAPEVPPGAAPLQFGKWMELRGMDVKQKPQTQPAAASAAPSREVKKVEKPVVKVVPKGDPWKAANQGNFTPIRVRWAGDRCSVCDIDVDTDVDQMVSCDACGITVHQSCYGILELPGVDDMWLCRACESREEGQPPPQCCLCPVVGGALKPTTEPGVWCHVTCMQWMPEVVCVDPIRMEPIDGIQYIQTERWSLTCCSCKQKMGAKIQCHDCFLAFHPLCARMAGLLMVMDAADNTTDEGTVERRSYCPRHCEPRPWAAGVQKIKGSQSATSDVSENGLWNGQTFPPQKCLAVPKTPAGCARAMAFMASSRKPHGAGVGWTSNEGFWIPDQTNSAMMSPNGHASGCHASRLLNKGSRRSASGRSRRAPAIGFARRNTSRPAADNEPPPPTDLMPLPEGLPPTVPVSCNGRSGVLNIRTQRVACAGGEVSCSRFEQMAGKGEAKKWKSSLWACDEEGNPQMQMQEWLTIHKLDRRMLQHMQANAVAYEAYQAWLDKKSGGDADGGTDKDGEAVAVDSEAVADKTDVEDDKAEDGEEPGSPSRLSQGEERDEGEEREEGEEGDEPGAEKSDMAMDDKSEGVTNASTDADGGDEEMESKEEGMVKLEEEDFGPELPEAAEVSGQPVGGAATPAEGHPAMEDTKMEGKKAGAAEAPPPLKDKRVRLVRAVAATDARVMGLMDVEAIAALPPEQQVGLCCRVWWPADEEWYAADVVEYNAATGCHRLWYYEDEESEWLDLIQEDAEQRLQWLPQTDASLWPPPPRPPPSKRRALQLVIRQQGNESDTPAASASPHAAKAVIVKEEDDDSAPGPNVRLPHRQKTMSLTDFHSLDSISPAGEGDKKQHSSSSNARNNNLPLREATEATTDRVQVGVKRPREEDTAPANKPGRVGGHTVEDGPPSRAGIGNGGNNFFSKDLPPRTSQKPPMKQNAPHDAAIQQARANSNVFDEDPAARGGVNLGTTPRHSEDARGVPSRLLFANRGSGGSSGVLIDMKLESDDALSLPGRAGMMPGLVHAGLSGGLSEMSLPHWGAGSPVASDVLANGALGDGLGVWPDAAGLNGGGSLFGRVSRNSLGISNLSNMSNLEVSAGVANGDTPGMSLRGSPTNHADPGSQDTSPHTRPTSPTSHPRTRGGNHNHTSPADDASHPPSPRTEPNPSSHSPSAPSPRSPHPTGPDAVGWRIGVWWSDDACYYYGNLLSFHAETNTHLIHYDDDEKEWLQLDREPVVWLRGPVVPDVVREEVEEEVEDDGGEDDPDQGAESEEEERPFKRVNRATAGPNQADILSDPLSTSVRIVCNMLKGTFMLHGFVVLLDSGKSVSPTEFERLAGKGSSKKWKSSLRVMKADGSPGITMQEWLLQAGVDVGRGQPKAAGGEYNSTPALSSRPSVSLEEVRRQQRKREADRQKVERQERDRQERERVDRERHEREKRQKQERERERERQERERVERERVERERQELERQDDMEDEEEVDDGGDGDQIGGRQGHKANCMCVICKQARRKSDSGKPSEARSRSTSRGRPPLSQPPKQTPQSPHNTRHTSTYLDPFEPSTHTGEGNPSDPSGSPRSQTPPIPFEPSARPPTQRALSKLGREARSARTRPQPSHDDHRTFSHRPPSSGAKPSAPSVRSGKGAFLKALPHIVRGPQQHSYWSTPRGRAWTPEAWAALQLGQPPAVVEALNSGISSTPAGGGSLNGSNLADMDTTEPDDALLSLSNNGLGSKAAVKVSKISLWRERIRQCHRAERERLTFGKSGIHGWGLFAKQPIPQDTMLFEYRGMALRPIVADLLEKQYHKTGTDCYLFHVNDDLVLDATRSGTVGRFTNHCCAPSMYTKVLDLDGEVHLCFFARTDIKAGQELTFDYRFKEEEGDSKLKCRCGAPNCRGYLN